jgi:hypothetical protein
MPDVKKYAAMLTVTAALTGGLMGLGATTATSASASVGTNFGWGDELGGLGGLGLGLGGFGGGYGLGGYGLGGGYGGGYGGYGGGHHCRSHHHHHGYGHNSGWGGGHRHGNYSRRGGGHRNCFFKIVEARFFRAIISRRDHGGGHRDYYRDEKPWTKHHGSWGNHDR